MEFLRQKDVEEARREEYYWAQIAAEVRRSWVKDKKRIKVKDFLIKFSLAKKSEKLNAEEKELQLNKSKSFWMGLVSLGKRKK